MSDLQDLFSAYGEVTSVTLPLDDSERSKVYALISFTFPDHAGKSGLIVESPLAVTYIYIYILRVVGI